MVAAVAVLCLSQTGAAALRVIAVAPPRGSEGAPTEITISGEGFEAGARVALLGGGPYLAGSHLLPEGARAVEITGTHACVTFYSHTAKLGGIQILDLADPAAPVPMGSFETGDSGLDVRISGHLAYLTFLNPYTFLGGLHIVDVGDPSEPRRVGTFDTILDPQRMTLAGEHVLVAAGAEGLKIIDVGDPAAPVLAGEYATAENAVDVAMSGSYAFVAAGADLLVIDVGDPAAPVLAGALERTGGSLAGLAISGTRLYAADTAGALLEIDVADPVHPVLLAQVPLADSATGVAVAGRFAYVSAGYSGLQVIDLERAGGPAVAGSQGLFGNSGYFAGVALSGRYAYVADLVNGVHVIDVGTPAAPRLLGSLDVTSYPPGTGNPGVVVSGGVAYMADADRGLLAIDVADPAAPALAGSLGVPGTARGLAVSEGHVFLADGASGVRTIAIGEAGELLPAGGIDTPGEAQGIAIAAGHAYVADGSRGLAVLDIRDPRSPALVGSIDTTGNALAVAVSGGLAFVADDFRGLQIFDVGRPEAPLLAGKVDTPGRAVGVAVADGRAYVADLNRGLQIVDVSRPAAPALIANLGTPGEASGVAFNGDRLLVADGFSGLLEVDVRDPARPAIVGVHETPGIASGVAVFGGLAYVADGTGLRVVRLNPPLPAPSVVTPGTIVLTVPPGLAPGAYDVSVSNPAGSPEALPNGFAVCGRRELSARLVPVDLRGGRGDPASASWRLVLDGDGEFFQPQPRHRARLLLPVLPADLEVRSSVGQPAGPRDPGVKAAIELHLPAASGSGVVLLLGPRGAGMEDLWAGIARTGGIDLPRFDERSYGDFRLSTPVDRPSPAAPARYRFEFEGGRLTAVRAAGAAAVLDFEVEATDDAGCVTRALAGPQEGAR